VGLKSAEAAETTLRRRLAKQPSDAYAHLELGKALTDAKDESGGMKELQRAISIDPDLDEAQRLVGLALGRRGDEAQGFYHLAVAARLRGDLEQSLSHFVKCDELEPDGTPRKRELAEAIEELEPLVRTRLLERRERRGRRGLAIERLERRSAR
jgi:tetratricopeptide (TPR) repeat protein